MDVIGDEATPEKLSTEILPEPDVTSVSEMERAMVVSRQLEDIFLITLQSNSIYPICCRK